MAKVINGYIWDDSNEFSKTALVQSSGRIPKDQRPDISPRDDPLKAHIETLMTPFQTFLRRDLAPRKGWMFEDGKWKAPVYMSNGTEERFRRLIRLKDLLNSYKRFWTTWLLSGQFWSSSVAMDYQ